MTYDEGLAQRLREQFEEYPDVGIHSDPATETTQVIGIPTRLMNRLQSTFCTLLVLCPLHGHAQELESSFTEKLVEAALERTSHRVTYDGSYRRIDYPNGDVPDDVGVCTDVIVRSYRALGVDLQQLVHEDMSASFTEYPQNWGLRRPDPNIDHRRVPNLQVFFERHGAALPKSLDPGDYQPGDLVTWMLPGNLPHIGVVTDHRSIESWNPLIVHNIGAGPKSEDILFKFPITGHYRYLGPANNAEMSHSQANRGNQE